MIDFIREHWGMGLIVAGIFAFAWFQGKAMEGQARANRTWKTRDGASVPFDDLQTHEIDEIIRWMERTAEVEQDRVCLNFPHLRPPLKIDHPQYLFLKAEQYRRHYGDRS